MIHNGRRSSGSNLAVEINRKKTSSMGVNPERFFLFVDFVNISYFKNSTLNQTQKFLKRISHCSVIHMSTKEKENNDRY